jgi:hypothetical protein
MPDWRAIFVAVVCAAAAAQAQDRFEIQVYDSEVARAGEPGLEVHVNYVASGSSFAEGPELTANHVLHTTLEPHFGLFGWAELGGYLQGALRPDGSYDYAGAKLRFKAKWPEKLFGFLGLAVNTELSLIPEAYEANRWGSEVRPIVDARIGPFYASVNPILATDLEGPFAGHPQLEPAAKLALFVVPAVAVGAEYYGGFGPLDSPLPSADQDHHLYGALDFAGAWFDLNLGVGRGFGTGEAWVAKAIFGVHPRDPAPSTSRRGAANALRVAAAR